MKTQTTARLDSIERRLNTKPIELHIVYDDDDTTEAERAAAVTEWRKAHKRTLKRGAFCVFEFERGASGRVTAKGFDDASK
jgi:hypothetical protein